MSRRDLPRYGASMELRIVRITDCFDEACRFYGEILGWPITKEWDEGGRGRIFGYGESARLELLEGTPDPVTGVVLSVEVADLDAVAATLTTAGSVLTQPPAVQPWGHRNLALVDPAGVTLVLFEVM